MRCEEVAGWVPGSCRFWCPTPRACRFARPVGATAGEVLALADQPLVELASEQGDLGLTEVMADGAAGEADMLPAAGDQEGRIQLGPAFWDLEEGRGHGRPCAMRTPVLAERAGFVCPARGACRPIAGRWRLISGLPPSRLR